MTPTKPAAHAPPPPPPARPHAPNAPALLVKGPLFASILADKALPAAPKLPPPPQAPQGAVTTALPQAVIAVHAEPDKHQKHAAHDDELDPSTRQTAQLAPPMTAPARPDEAAAAPLANARVSLEDLVPQLVKKIAWSGDAQRGTVRMELGAGELSGATLTVSAEHGRVSVRVDTPPGTDTGAWRDRLHARLAARGLDVESVEVR